MPIRAGLNRTEVTGKEWYWSTLDLSSQLEAPQGLESVIVVLRNREVYNLEPVSTQCGFLLRPRRKEAFVEEDPMEKMGFGVEIVAEFGRRGKEEEACQTKYL